MNGHVIIILMIFQSIISIAQTNEQKPIDKWINKNNIKLNDPQVPDRFNKKIDCKNRSVAEKFDYNYQSNLQNILHIIIKVKDVAVGVMGLFFLG